LTRAKSKEWGFSLLEFLAPGFEAGDKHFRRTGLVFRADAKQRCLCFGMLAEFLHLVDDTAFRLVLFPLDPALGLLALFLLARLFFLAFSKSRSSSWHSQFLLSLFACGAGPPVYASGCFQKTRKLPAWFARLACMPLIVVATSSTASPTPTAKVLSTTTAPTASWAVRLRLRLVNLQRAAAQFRSIQSRDCFVSLGGIGHFHETEASGSARLPVGHNADFFHRTVRLENRSQFRLGCAVGQITYVKILHCSSSLSKSSKVLDSAATRFDSRDSKSRGGAGLSCVALVRAWDIERTAEIRRDASRIPQRCDTSPRRSAASAALMSSLAP
jgi:hypothetical protein